MERRTRQLLMRFATTLLACLMTSGCVHLVGGFCQIAKPIRFEATDLTQASDVLLDGVLAHDEVGAKLCGWH